MRARAGLLLALVVVLAGCSVGFQGPVEEGPTAEPTDGPTTTPGAGTPTPTAGPTVPPDPPSDTLGWEAGYWHNESIPIDRSDGLNESEREALVARTMARVEYLRDLEFRERVPITVVSREEYRDRFVQATGNETASFRAFDNAKFEALFLIGEDRNSLAVQNQNRGSNVLGFYSPKNDSIVIVSDAPTPEIDRSTLAHELVHALQDQHTDLLDQNRSTREEYNAVNGLIEGEANLVQQRFDDRCLVGDWDCVEKPERGGGSGGDLHLGVYILNYFPYSEGPWFVKHFQTREGWDGVTAMYDQPPASTAQVIEPETYGQPAPTVSLADEQTGDWQRLRPERQEVARADHASLGQSAMVAMFAYSLYDEYNDSQVIRPRDFLNVVGQQVNQTRPFDYGFDAVSGWDGDRMHVYWKPGADDPVNRTAYVWKTEWDSAEDAREFAATYRRLLDHWGGDRVGENVWRVRGSTFADAFSVRVEGSTVVVVNAPNRGQLEQVRPGSTG